MGHRVAALLTVVLSLSSYTGVPVCERSQRRWEIECLQAMYETSELSEAQREAEQQRLNDVVCPELTIATLEACPAVEDLPTTTPEFDRWLDRWFDRREERYTSEQSPSAPSPEPPACSDESNCV